MHKFCKVYKHTLDDYNIYHITLAFLYAGSGHFISIPMASCVLYMVWWWIRHVNIDTYGHNAWVKGGILSHEIFTNWQYLGPHLCIMTENWQIPIICQIKTFRIFDNCNLIICPYCSKAFLTRCLTLIVRRSLTVI